MIGHSAAYCRIWGTTQKGSDIENMLFKPEFNPTCNQTETALWFLFDQGHLLTKINADRFSIPDSADLKSLQIAPSHKLHLGSIDGRPCYAAQLETSRSFDGNFKLNHLRTLFGFIPDTLVWVAGRGNQLLNWHLTHRYCGKCGQETEDKTDERAKMCPKCQHTNYPRLSPAVIVAIVKDDLILLARNRQFKGPFYSVLAGFVEPGESLEECVKREIKEEVGITVKNIRYFGSQPWPFPDSLMIAFVSDYASGEIVIDGSEIVEAAWFTKDKLPQIPPKISIARQLIDWFCQS
jgi:NAD+ diphosphatase